MELGKSVIPEQVTYGGSSQFILEAGKSLKIETSPNGSDVLNAQVPAGKVWEVHITITVAENDA